MKTKIFSILTFMAALLLSSCSEKWEPGVTSEKNGQVSLSSMGLDVSVAETVISRATVDLSDFRISIKNNEGMTVNAFKYSEMPEILTLPVGTYTLDVVSHEVKRAAWDEPLYVGSKEFEITENQITDLGTVKCVFSNIKVSIVFTDALRKVASDDVKVTVVANDGGELEFTLAETRAGFFEAMEGSTTIVATLTGTINSTAYTNRVVLTDAKAGQHRIITYDFKGTVIPDPEENGKINPGDGIGLDVTYDEVDLNNPVDDDDEVLDPSDRPGKEDPKPDEGDTPGPKPDKDVITYTSTNEADFNLDGVNDALDGREYGVIFAAENGIADIVVTIDSPYLTD